MEKEKIDRINHLARKHRAEGLTEEEKAEQKALALKRYQEEELRKLQVRHSKPRASMPKETIQPQPSLFDF